jgi:glycosyltransferase involved in cell wall biosynthesis
MPPTVWITLPTYNEAQNLEGLVRAVVKQLELTVPGHGHVVVVDDSSPDGTGEIADRLAAELPQVEVLHRAGKEGLGKAYLAGFRYAHTRGADLIIVMDADVSHDPSHIPALIEAAEHVFEYPMVDRDPLPAWRHGRVTLLGDAAHPMYPIGSNGASQAILDARVLTRAFLDHGVGPEALAAYEGERRPATSRIVLANRANGPDQVLQIVEERCGGDFRNVHDVLTREELEETAAAYKRLAGFDRDALNARAPIVPHVGRRTIGGLPVAPAARTGRLS